MTAGKRIYIIGFMGSGKTTAGKKLASLLQWSFIDLDKKIEEDTGKTIPKIFSQSGEEYFRNVESKVLKNLNSESDLVVSTGGGAPCWEDNMDFMLGSGLTIYLKLTPDQLKKRLSGSKTERPLIKNLDEHGLSEFIKKKLAEREIIYDRAVIIVEEYELDINALHSAVRSYLTL